jgi:ABC-type protease/lipase transport system fused ATPase/permease subunit
VVLIRFLFSYILFIIIIGGILVLLIYVYITRLASNEIFSPSNKTHLEVGRAKDLVGVLGVWEGATTFIHIL